MNRPNSKDAYRSLELTERQEAVIKLLSERKSPLTDKDIKDVLGFSKTTGIVTDMIFDGRLKQVGDILDPRTGVMVRLVDLAVEPPRHEIAAQISTLDRECFDTIAALMEQIIQMVKRTHPGSKIRGELLVKFGSRITHIECASSDGQLGAVAEEAGT